MGRRTCLVAAVCIFLHVGAILLGTLAVVAEADQLNTSGSGGLYWATAKEEEDLPKRASEADETVVIGPQNDELDGGFSSLEGMLHWAIGRSDPAKLRETAQKNEHLSNSYLKKRQQEMKELMNQLKMPSDAQLMQVALTDLTNASLSLEEHRRALEEILILVESIDNANDLHKLGALAVVIRELDSYDTETRISSAWILGKAGQNNPIVQNQILELGALAKLMKMVKSSDVEEAIKALFAVSALIRNNEDGQKLFYAEAGELILQGIMSNSSVDIRLHKKSAFLVADLAEFELESENKEEPSFFSDPFFMKCVVELTTSMDLDLQEKALMAIKSLLQLKTTKALDFKIFCGLDGVLERMREQLKQLMAVEYVSDFARDMESLRSEVELIFRKKLEKQYGTT